MAKEFTDDNFKVEVLEASKPVLVDFWAPWCGPCMMVKPIIEKLAEEYEGKILIGKVDVDENPNIASEYDIKGIPAFKVFKDGKVIDEFTGALSEDALREKIKNII